MITRIVRRPAPSLLLVLAPMMGCAQPGSIQLSSVASSPVGSFTSSEGTVAIGTVVAFSAQPQDSSGKDTGATVTASVDDTTIAQVIPVSWTNEFVVVGVASGTTTLRVQANGDETSTLPIHVVVQGDSEP